MTITLTRPESKSSDASAEAKQYLDEMPSRKRFTRDEFHLLPPEIFQRQGRRYELISGDFIEKPGQKEPHIGLLLRWAKALVGAFGIDNVRSQMPVVFADDTELEPDISVVSQTNDSYLALRETAPAEDVRLIVEISVSTPTYDTTTKASAYARSGIMDFWVVNVASRSLIVHRDPTPDGYGSIVSYSETESVSPLAKPEATFLVSNYLP